MDQLEQQKVFDTIDARCYHEDEKKRFNQ